METVSAICPFNLNRCNQFVRFYCCNQTTIQKIQKILSNTFKSCFEGFAYGAGLGGMAVFFGTLLNLPWNGNRLIVRLTVACMISRCVQPLAQRRNEDPRDSISGDSSGDSIVEITTRAVETDSPTAVLAGVITACITAYYGIFIENWVPWVEYPEYC